ncbi:DUF6515 family protein [Flectobacillus roseus]|uniref:DUF6515 family protein n=1 Tax=Flectobacillus roseus TaxID=502259 RepID=A0ABT6Y8B4_9BACT|nr:DUF6515 family protein [Flectobacillus roseus]MDI9859790.1 DUF6515 family protein [Flectobacillus roseus]
MTPNFVNIAKPTVGKQSFLKPIFTFFIAGALMSTFTNVQAQRGHDDRYERGRDGDYRYDKKDRDNRGNDRRDDNRRNDNRRDDNRRDEYRRDDRRGPDRVVVVDRTRPNWQYANIPSRNAHYNALPTGHLSINFGGIRFAYHQGVFYKPYNSEYVVCQAPVGIRVNVLPRDCRRVVIRNVDYYYYNGTYYRPYGNEYATVAPPIGALVESIPGGYEKLMINGETYYVVDGIQYRAVLNRGEIWYEVIKIM